MDVRRPVEDDVELLSVPRDEAERRQAERCEVDVAGLRATNGEAKLDRSQLVDRVPTFAPWQHLHDALDRRMRPGSEIISPEGVQQILVAGRLQRILVL